MNNYRIFSRSWWKRNPNYPNGLEPRIGRKNHICFATTEDEARIICKKWNDDYMEKHRYNRYSVKAEFEKNIGSKTKY